MTALNIETIQQERALVQQNIQNLEAQINQLNAQLQQTNANLLASRGAILGFDRLLELASAQAPAAETPAEPTIVK